MSSAEYMYLSVFQPCRLSPYFSISGPPLLSPHSCPLSILSFPVCLKLTHPQKPVTVHVLFCLFASLRYQLASSRSLSPPLSHLCSHLGFPFLIGMSYLSLGSAYRLAQD